MTYIIIAVREIALEQGINGEKEDEEQRKRNAAHHQRRSA